MKRIISAVAALSLFSTLIISTAAAETSPGGEQAVSERQPITAEAKKYLDRAMVAIEMAKSDSDYRDAIRELQSARSIAPGCPEIYYNLGLVQDKVGDFEDAAASFRMCLRLDPSGPNSKDAQTQVNRIEYKRDRQKQNVQGKSVEGIFAAISYCSTGKVQSLLDSSGINLKEGQSWSLTSTGEIFLTAAVNKRCYDLVRLLIQKGANINMTDYGKTFGGRTALMCASQNGDLPMMELLLSLGADVNAKIKASGEQKKYAGQTALMRAALTNQKPAMEMLLKNGADINAVSDGGETALFYAVHTLPAAELLVKGGVNVDATDRIGRTALMNACDSVKGFDTPGNFAALLVKNAADVNVKDLEGRTAVMHAVVADETEDLSDPDLYDMIQKKGRKGRSMIAVRSRRGYEKIARSNIIRVKMSFIRFLADSGADLNIKDKNGNTALMLALDYDEDIADTLLYKGANPDVKDLSGRTALLMTAEKGDVDMLKLLLKRGATTGVSDNIGRSPLHIACDKGNLEVAEILLEKGADPNAVDKNGDTPLTLSDAKKFTALSVLLRKKGAR